MKKILVVDDDPDILEAMELILMTEGYNTKVILRGEDAHDKARQFSPDLIILDMLLSGVDGREICQVLKNSDDTRHIPVIMFSAHPLAHETVTKYGADSFIAKPFPIDELLVKVKKHLKNS